MREQVVVRCEFYVDLLGNVERLHPRSACVPYDEQMSDRVGVRRFGDERTDVFGRIARIAGFFGKLTCCAIRGLLTVVDGARNELEKFACDAVLVLPHQDDAILRREGKNDRIAAALTNVILLDEGPVRKLDPVPP